MDKYNKRVPFQIGAALLLMGIMTFAGGCGGGSSSTSAGSSLATPTNLFAIEETAGQYDIEWTAVTGATKYVLARIGPITDNQDVTGTTFTDTDTTRLYYQVKACDASTCYTFANAISPLNIPKNFKAGELFPAGVLLEWKAVEAADSYKLYRNCNLASEVEIVVSGQKTDNYSDTDVTAETEYQYCITSCSSSRCSARSDVATYTTPAASE